MGALIEKQVSAAYKAVEKAQKGIERLTKWNEKKEAKCIKLNCLWTTFEEFVQHRDTDMTPEQYAAYFDWSLNQNNIKDYQRQLEQAQKHLNKVLGVKDDKEAEEADKKYLEGIENDYYDANMYHKKGETEEERRAKYEAWLKRFKKSCAKDGITIYEADSYLISGTDYKGRRFCMYINNGFTCRSDTSYTLRLDGETIFASGLFSTGYRYLRKK